jgi:hypothetical protein
MNLRVLSRHDRNNVKSPQWILCILALGIVGCADSTDGPSIERVSVEGMVTLDGQPLEAGAIVFHGPLNSGDGSVITAYAFINDGRYEIDAGSGPAIGTSLVEIRPKPRAREEYEASLDEAAKSRSRRTASPTVIEIPEEYYGQHTELRAELVGGKRNKHNIQLDSRS